MKLIEILLALIVALILVPIVAALLPLVGLWFASAYCLLVVLGFTQEVLKGT